MAKLKFFSSLLLFLLVSVGVNAQYLSATATIDSSFIKIGQQTQIRVVVDAPQGVDFSFPDIHQGDSLTSGVELLMVSKTDTSMYNGKFRFKKDYLVTSFDTGVYRIPPFFMTLKDGTRSQTNELSLEVVNIDREIVDGKFEDIKDLMEIPFDFVHFIKVLILLLFIVLALASIAYYAYNYWKKHNEKPEPVIVEPERVYKPHEIALMELDRIKADKIWNSGQYKQYYTELTDTLREYLSKRFSISAWEMTSAEILDELQYKEEAYSICDKLKQIFSVSDMVKFAKMEPDSETCTLSLVNGYFVVNQTIVQEPVALDLKSAEQPQSEIKTVSEN
ncbi:MAG: BatD family protein [Paludibacteraceae bacterium]|nr:BatD family protein [Paludibacteraceae bacterium]